MEEAEQQDPPVMKALKEKGEERDKMMRLRDAIATAMFKQYQEYLQKSRV